MTEFPPLSSSIGRVITINASSLYCGEDKRLSHGSHYPWGTGSTPVAATVTMGEPSRGVTDFDGTHPKFCSIRTQNLLISRGERMSKIYKIVNDINDKVYVGKTTSTIENRFK